MISNHPATRFVSPAPTGQPGAARPAIFGWIMFDWASQPVFLLVQTFFFGPYFVNHFATDPVTGQIQWGYVMAASGLAVAFLSPVLGAIADASGRRKRWVLVFSTMLVVGSATLWFAEPGETQRMPVIMAAVILAFVGAEFATVFTNAMLPSLVPVSRIGRLSGIGWAAGYAGGLLALGVFAAGVLPNATGTATLLGLTPWLPIDIAGHTAERATGPIAALWFVVFMLPFFALTGDPVRSKAGSVRNTSEIVLSGIRQLRTTLTQVRANALVFRFLLARMLYADGLSAIFAFGGIYGASIFGWSATDLGVFAVLLTITGLIGAVAGGFADDRFGPKPVIVTALFALVVFAGALLSIDPGHIGWFYEVAPTQPTGPRFASPAEWAFLAAAAGLGLTAGPLQSASRSMMARLTPPDHASEFFGFFAFSGKATAFAAPAAVTLITWISASQRIGMSVIAVFILTGLALLLTLDLPGGQASSSRD